MRKRLIDLQENWTESLAVIDSIVPSCRLTDTILCDSLGLKMSQCHCSDVIALFTALY